MIALAMLGIAAFIALARNTPAGTPQPTSAGQSLVGIGGERVSKAVADDGPAR